MAVLWHMRWPVADRWSDKLIDFSGYDFAKLRKAAETPIWIDTEEQLAHYCQQWLEVPLITLDTEFIRTSTFYAKPGLIQVADQHSCYLIDPLPIKRWRPFRELLEAPQVLKVLHACGEDVELFKHRYKAAPSPMFDTQVAAAFCGWGFSMGLQRLVKHALDIDLDKGETKSDWLQRPLTDNQTLYAALDVCYLAEIAQMQFKQLEKLDRTDWVNEECEELVASVIANEANVDDYYRRFSQLWNIPTRKLAALRDLTIWRERTSRLRDKARNRILSNHQIIDVIQQWPNKRDDLRKIEGLRSGNVWDFGNDIIRCLKNADKSAQDNPPEPIEQPLKFKFHAHLKALRAVGAKAAEQHNVAPELMLRKRDIEALIRTGVETGQYELPDSLCGWRKPLIGQALLDQLAELNESN